MSPRSCSLREAAWAAVVLAIFQAGLFLPHLWQGQALLPVRPDAAPPWFRPGREVLEAQDFSGTDKLVYIYPNLVRWTREVRRDPEALLWNPDSFCGAPFLATHATHVLYPLNVVYLLWGPRDGLLISALLHGWLACFLAWLALRRLVGAWGAALVGAVVYGSSGWIWGHHDLIQPVQAASWIPLVVWGVDVLLERCRWAGFAAVAGGVSLGFLAGMPQITLVGLLGAGLLALPVAIIVWRRRGWRPALAGPAAALAGLLAGCLLAAPQLLPTLEASRLSGRAELDLDELRATSVQPWELSGFVLPELLGDPPEIWRLGNETRASAEGERERQAFALSVAREGFLPARAAGLGAIGTTFIERVFYPGVAALVLILLALLSRPGWRELWALLLVALGLLAAMDTVLLDAVYALPGFKFGNNRRLLLLAVMGLAMLAALGAGRLPGLVRRSPAWLALVLVAALPAALLVWNLLDPGGLLETLAEGGSASPQAALLEEWFLIKTLPALVACSLLAPVLWFAARLGSAGAALCILAILAADLGHLNARCNPGQERIEVGAPSALTTWLAERSVGPGAAGVVAPEAAPDVGGQSLPRIIRFKNPAYTFAGHEGDLVPLPPNLGTLYGIPDAQGYEAIVDRHLEQVMECVEPGLAVRHHLVRELRRPESLASPLLDLMGVRYVLAAAEQLPGLVRVFADLDERVAIHERASALGRLQTPGRLQVLADEASLLRRLASPDFDPRREVLLLEEDARTLGLPGGAPPAGGSWECPAGEVKVTLLAYTATEVRVAYETAGPRPLLLADGFHPGWEAELDGGDELAVVRADHAFRLVLLPAGHGELVFRYWPRSFQLGLLAAVAGLLLPVAVGLWCGRRGRGRAQARRPPAE